MELFYPPTPIYPFEYFPDESMFRTLLVDDEPVFLAVSKAFLEKEADISCETCESAQEARDLIRTGSFDAVVSDYDMPRMDGIALLKAVRADDPELPFILLTGRGREEVVIEALNHGADFYLQKSTEPRALYAELASKIRHAVDRRRARGALHKSEENFRLALQHSPTVFFHQDRDLRYTWIVNSRSAFPPETVLGKTDEDLFLPEDAAALTAIKRRVLETGTGAREVVQATIEGVPCYCDLTVEPLRDEKGAVIGVQCASHDITAQKQGEEDLKESREQYRQLFQHSPGGIAIHDGETVLFCNHVAAEIFGAEDEQEVVGRPMLKYVHLDYRDLVKRRIAEIHKGDHRIAPNVEERFIRKDGSVIDVQVTAAPVTFAGRPAIQVVFHDITERKQKERERLILKQQLETEIRDLNLLHSLSTRYLEKGDFNALLQEILETAISITGADKGNLQLLDPATGMLKIVAQKHFKRPFLKFFEYVDAGDATACGAALERLERVVVEDICESPVFDEETLKVLLEEDLRAVQSTPLVSRHGHLLGILSTHFCRVHAPMERELRLVDIMARQAADMIERTRAEETLREREKNYRDLVEHANSVILKMDTGGNITFFNDFAQRFFGYTLEEVLGRNVVGTIVPEKESSWRDMRKAIRNVCADPEEYKNSDNENITKDGRRVWIQWTNRAIFDEHGTAVGVLCIGNDISEQKRAEHELKESEQRLNLAIESAHLGAWDKNLIDGEVVTHGYWPGILGYTDYDDVPPWEEAVHPDDRERVANDLQAHMKGETPCVKLEYRMKRKDGRYSWILSRGKVVERDDGGRPLRMIGVDHDISPLHASRESLREANRKLNLLSSITRHDILNQVSAQKAFLALLEEHIPADTEAQGLYQHLLATSDTIRRQITFTGDYQHMGERDPEWLHVRWVVKRAAESVRLNGIRLEIATPLPEIFADPMLEKAFFNLLENATVHGNSPITIRVSFRSRDGDGVIVLEDDGVGVPAAQKEEIFEKGIGKNTGLGLFLTREILEITDISIRECGEEGRGARFEIAIPRGKWRMERVGG